MFQISTHRKLKKIPTVRTGSPQDLETNEFKIPPESQRWKNIQHGLTQKEMLEKISTAKSKNYKSK